MRVNGNQSSLFESHWRNHLFCIPTIREARWGREGLPHSDLAFVPQLPGSGTSMCDLIVSTKGSRDFKGKSSTQTSLSKEGDFIGSRNEEVQV